MAQQTTDPDFDTQAAADAPRQASGSQAEVEPCSAAALFVVVNGEDLNRLLAAAGACMKFVQTVSEQREGSPRATIEEQQATIKGLLAQNKRQQSTIERLQSAIERLQAKENRGAYPQESCACGGARTPLAQRLPVVVLPLVLWAVPPEAVMSFVEAVISGAVEVVVEVKLLFALLRIVM